MEHQDIRDRVEAASAGDWERHGADVRAGGELLFRGRDGTAGIRAQADRDADFVAHARADILTLLDRVEQLTLIARSSLHDPPPREQWLG